MEATHGGPRTSGVETHQALSVGARRSRLALLRLSPFFERLTDIELEAIASLLSEARFEHGELIEAAGTPVRSAHLIQEGEVGVFFGDNAEKVPMDRLRRGDLFGGGSFFDPGIVSGFTMRALSDVVALSLPGRELRRLCDQCPRIGYVMMSVFSQRLLRRMYELYQNLTLPAGGQAL